MWRKNKNCFELRAIHSSSTFIHQYGEYTFLVHLNSEKSFKWSWIIKSEKKIFQVWQFENPLFCVWKVVGHFCNFQVFLSTTVLKPSAIADDRPLFAMLEGDTFYVLDVMFFKIIDRFLMVFSLLMSSFFNMKIVSWSDLINMSDSLLVFVPLLLDLTGDICVRFWSCVSKNCSKESIPSLSKETSLS